MSPIPISHTVRLKQTALPSTPSTSHGAKYHLVPGTKSPVQKVINVINHIIRIKEKITEARKAFEKIQTRNRKELP